MGGELISVLGSLINALFLVASIYVYVALLRQVGNRGTDPALASEPRFGLPEVAVAVFLMAIFAFFALMSYTAGADEIPHPRVLDLVGGILWEIGILLTLLYFLRLRRFDITKMAGLARLTFRRAFATGLVLVIFAYPLLIFADWLTVHILGRSASRQSIIELFGTSQRLDERVIIIVTAVVVAPLAEEFMFRFFLYGVLRRYAGRTVALVISALLFAAVHAHLPSFGPLFVLGACLTLAYEWSGTLLVPMTMHAIFNALTLTALAFPDAAQP